MAMDIQQFTEKAQQALQSAQHEAIRLQHPEVTSLHLLFHEEAGRALGIPEHVTQTVLLPVGYVRDAVLRPAQRKPPHEVTFWNRWGECRPGQRDVAGEGGE